MKQEQLNFYRIDNNYIEHLSKIDSHIMSCSKNQGKENRPFVGIIVICNDLAYCIPLSSPKTKHSSMKNNVCFTKIIDNEKIIGVLNFNNMIPIRNDLIKKIDLKITENDTSEQKAYKSLMIKQLTFCRQNKDTLIKKANKLHKLCQNTDNQTLAKMCCNFKSLEKFLDKYSNSP